MICRTCAAAADARLGPDDHCDGVPGPGGHCDCAHRTDRYRPEVLHHVIEVSADEWRAAVRRSLAALGVTYPELERQAADDDFRHPRAQALWVSIGGTVTPADLEEQEARS